MVGKSETRWNRCKSPEGWKKSKEAVWKLLIDEGERGERLVRVAA